MATRPFKAGIRQGKSLVETTHLMYLDKNCLAYLIGIKVVIDEEIERRVINGGTHHKKEKDDNNNNMSVQIEG